MGYKNVGPAHGDWWRWTQCGLPINLIYIMLGLRRLLEVLLATRRSSFPDLKATTGPIEPKLLVLTQGTHKKLFAEAFCSRGVF